MGQRLLDEAKGGTCASAVAESAAIWGDKSTAAEADQMERLVKEGRQNTDWTVEPPL